MLRKLQQTYNQKQMASYFNLAYVGIGLSGLFAFYIWKKFSVVPNPPRVTNLKKSCISIPSPGGFDRLCHTDAPYGSIGANIQGIKPGILPQHPSKYDDKIKKNLVMVEIHAFGLNYADCCIRWGLYASAKKFVGWPITPGFEFSGKVLWIGDEKSSKFKIGDQVFGVTMFGANSTHITVPDHQIFSKPNNLSMSEAGCFLGTSVTAYYALFQLAAPLSMPYINESIIRHTNKFLANDNKPYKTPAKCVLIHSASGGVGSMLTQYCKRISNMDCVVGIVGGKHKIEMAKKMGCDIVIDRKSEMLKNGNIWDEIGERIPDFDGFDMIFDANGVATLKKSYENLKPTGRVIIYGFHTMLPHCGTISPIQWLKMGINLLKTPSFDPMKLVEENKCVLGFNLSFLFSRNDMFEAFIANVIPWIENNQIKVSKVTQYKMKDVGIAHRDIQTGKTIGKLVMITPHHDNYDNL